jgi:hypothetical protein
MLPLGSTGLSPRHCGLLLLAADSLLSFAFTGFGCMRDLYSSSLLVRQFSQHHIPLAMKEQLSFDFTGS